MLGSTVVTHWWKPDPHVHVLGTMILLHQFCTFIDALRANIACKPRTWQRLAFVSYVDERTLHAFTSQPMVTQPIASLNNAHCLESIGTCMLQQHMRSSVCATEYLWKAE